MSVAVKSPVVRIDPEIMSGTPCFAGTRVPVEYLFEYLRKGYNTGYFLSQFPTVTGEQVDQLLNEGFEQAVERAERVGR